MRAKRDRGVAQQVEQLEQRCLLSTMSLTPYINPFIGTTGGGNTFPGATTPQGLVQFSPDTYPHNTAGGYNSSDSNIRGFSVDHYSGRGNACQTDIGFMPVLGTVTQSPVANPAAFRPSFVHTNEIASAGYYSVQLDNSTLGDGQGPKVELSDTTRTGMMQITFPAGTTTGSLIINIGNSVVTPTGGQVNIVNGNEVTGWVQTQAAGGRPTYKIYFSAVFDQPIVASGTWNGSTLTANSTAATGPSTGAYLSFDTSSNKVVHVTVGVSCVSIANAQLNRTTENPGWNFAAVKQAASDAWNAKLNAVQINDPNAGSAKLTTFYTALYHTLIDPSIFDDVNGQYIGFDQAIHTLPAGHHHYTNISTWDFYRSDSPLQSLLFPNETADIAQSLIDDALQTPGALNGQVPRWVQANGDSQGMIGDGGSIVIENAFAFGATGFDTTAGLSVTNNNASVTSGGTRSAVLEYGSTSGMSDYTTLGYVSDQGSQTLEFAVADMSLALYAQSLGRNDLYQTYLARAQNWRRLFNPTSQLLNARNAAGNWDSTTTGWIEGSQMQYSWMVPFNLRGLFDAMGGNSAVISRLDSYFTTLNDGSSTSVNDFQGNEECETDAWAYLYAGTPWKTQNLVRRIGSTLYSNTTGGIPGNDDGGAMSSWYVFAALGIFPTTSGAGGFAIGSPLFASATITTDSGHVLQITGNNAADANPYVQDLQLNGQPSTSLWLPMSTILGSPTTSLSFDLGPTANTSWGINAADAPPSFDIAGTAPTIATAPSATPNPVTGTTATLSVLGADSDGESVLQYTWIAAASPTGVAAPTFSSTNGTNAGKNCTAAFHGVGTYTFQVQVSDGVISTYASVSVTVSQTATSLAITPGNVFLLPNGQQQFAATISDQFGNPMSAASVTWSVASGAGSISSTGLYTAAASAGAATIQATTGPETVGASIVVTNNADVASGLVGRWRFDDGSGASASDSATGTLADPGTLLNAPAWTTPGRVGSGDLTFTGANLQAVSVPDIAKLDITGSLTLSIWFKASVWNSGKLITKGDGQQYRLAEASGLGVRFELYGSSFGASSKATLTTNTTPTLNVWHHVVATYDGLKMTVYLDGVAQPCNGLAQTYFVASGAINTTSLPLVIGAQNTSSTDPTTYFNGPLDDARVYNRALSAAEVTQMFSVPSIPALQADQINDGSIQRSMITSATYTFSNPVALNPGAFTLTRRSDQLSVLVNWSTTDGKTYVLTFSGPGVVGGSLADGTYDLVMHASQVQDAFAQSIQGGDQTLTVGRLFGDWDGDGTVSSIDLAHMRRSYGLSAGQTGFDASFDYDGDGVISSIDLAQFRRRYGITLA